MEDMKTEIFELKMENLKIAHAAELASEKEKKEIMKKQHADEIHNLLITRDAIAESVAEEMYRKCKKTENGDTSPYQVKEVEVMYEQNEDHESEENWVYSGPKNERQPPFSFCEPP